MSSSDAATAMEGMKDELAYMSTINESLVNRWLLNLKSRALDILDLPPEKDAEQDVMEQLVKLYRESHLGRCLPARKSLYTAAPLPFSSEDLSITLIDTDAPTRVFKVAIKDAARADLHHLGMFLQGKQADAPQKALQVLDIVLRELPTSRRERVFKVAIKDARADLHHLGMFLQGKQADAPQEALQVLDIVLRELPTSRYAPVGRSFYSPNLGRRQSLGEGLESWPGLGIRPTQMGLSLNIDMSSTALIEPLPVIDFVTQLLNRDALARPLSDADRVKTVHHNAYHEDPCAKEFGIKISDKLAEVEARILPVPWTFNTEQILPPYTACPDHVERALKTRYSEAMNKLRGKQVDLLIVILPDNNGSLYGDLKRIRTILLSMGTGRPLPDLHQANQVFVRGTFISGSVHIPFHVLSADTRTIIPGLQPNTSRINTVYVGGWC